MERPFTGRDSERSKAPPLDVSFLSKGFFSDEGYLREELLDGEARNLARRFGPRGGFDKVSSAQIRRFFGDVKELEATLKREGIPFKSAMPGDLKTHLAQI